MTVFIKEASDYYQLLSEQHVDIAHSDTNRAFCRYQDMEQFNQLRSQAGKNIVLVKSFFGRAGGDYDDAEMLNTIVLTFSSYAKNVTSVEIVRASELSFRILMDFLTRMRQDFEEDDCTWLRWVKWGEIRFDEIEQPWLQNHYGWDLIIPYEATLPAYEAAKWNR